MPEVCLLCMTGDLLRQWFLNHHPIYRSNPMDPFDDELEEDLDDYDYEEDTDTEDF